MIALLRCIKSDFYKLRHTSILWIHLFIPLAGALIFLLYYHGRLNNSITDIKTYLEALAIAFPLLIGLISGIVIEQEEQAGNFQVLLATSKSKNTTYLSKLILLLLLGSFSITLAVGTFALGFHVLPYLFYLKAAGLLVLGNIFIYILHVFISLQFGKGASAGIGVAGSLISALMLTGLGDYIWHFVPWAWSVRLCNRMFEKLDYPDFSAEIAFDMQKGLFVMLFAICIAFVACLFWFKRWEGRKSYE
ncbi:lantibiotic immunity ABC transporter MutG family permease subunit [Clostridium estertheticum]|uniref:Lantibiotic immunity ABC transporter MutG family permease subunit n=1 Tax=Clostridium estertheticum TaxID=238834 RepID=A0AA47I637_9CLOT|nr:lantibiotic immunity ABC transporter MutG family permease subunit [Clostridium estertheticum]MBU3155727.1 lantibiotic immunity ABC transporter MutG family permease subunit [Clostridium estertheticum]MBU3201188.1 lantibiotic immunity ABC transporter MutG family permease subunit [Clostridium estertheticum]WAG59079.1 lantibiotic immunity ABC transporter MutG family permease subunit [Clostridium estertheticum]WAG66870.1 lantibiotic immunity ABC transporter MutG family permease subunit [Clostridi